MGGAASNPIGVHKRKTLKEIYQERRLYNKRMQDNDSDYDTDEIESDEDTDSESGVDEGKPKRLKVTNDEEEISEDEDERRDRKMRERIIATRKKLLRKLGMKPPTLDAKSSSSAGPKAVKKECDGYRSSNDVLKDISEASGSTQENGLKRK